MNCIVCSSFAKFMVKINDVEKPSCNYHKVMYEAAGYEIVRALTVEERGEIWGVTAQERVLNHLYEKSKGADGFLHDLYGVTESRAEAIMYVKDPDGNCWEIKAVPHPHPAEGYLDG